MATYEVTNRKNGKVFHIEAGSFEAAAVGAWKREHRSRREPFARRASGTAGMSGVFGVYLSLPKGGGAGLAAPERGYHVTIQAV